ncbi:MAG TPA: PQQ-binding-like beta-propeller repeat protein [Thermotogota bacterium]|nr:PQQ-binding-like beta-propeller repeat protein [Thermotogota bacterium]
MQGKAIRFLGGLIFLFLVLSLVGCNTPDGTVNLVLLLLEPGPAQAGMGLQPEFSWQVQINAGDARNNTYFLLNVAPQGEEYGDGVQTQQTRATWNQKLLANHTYRWKVEAWLEGKKVASSEERTFATQDFYTVELGVEGSQGGQVRTDEGQWGKNLVFQANVETPTRLWAQAEENYTFDGWYQGDDLLGIDNPFDYLPTAPSASTRQLESDIQLQARFDKTQCEITVLASPTNAGDVRVNDGEWDEQSRQTVEAGQQVSVQAQAGQGFQFDGWYQQEQTGARAQKASDDNPFLFVAQVDRVLSAYFVPQTFSITVQASPASRGNVRVNDGPWGALQQEELQRGSQVEVRALAKEGSTFDGWYEDGLLVSRNASFSWNVDANRTLQASFSQKEPEPGTPLWVFHAGDGIYSSPAIGSDGAIYFGTIGEENPSQFFALNPDGTPKWPQPFLPGEYGVFASPALGSDDTIFFGTAKKNNLENQEGIFYVLNPEDGTKKLDIPPASGVLVGAAVGEDGTIFVGSIDHDVNAFNPEDWTSPWDTPFSTGERIQSAPSIGEDGTVYVGSNDTNLYALDPADGTSEWATPCVVGQVLSSPAIGSDGTIYVSTAEGKVYAIDPEDATSTWATPFEVGFYMQSSPVIGSDGTIYVGWGDLYGTGAGKLFALDGEDGSQKWEFDTPSVILASATIGKDGTIFVGSFDGFFYAIHPDGSLKWKFDAGSLIYSSAAIAPDGTIYFGTAGGDFYALYSDCGGLADTPWPKFRQNNRNTGRKE